MTVRWVLIAALVACSGRAAPPHRDGSAPTPVPHDAPTVEVPARALGMPDLAGYGWRKRAGQPAFRLARKAEFREDWPSVAVACKQALAADPGHLEAAWLLAVALAKTGKPDEVLAPLAIAAAGDFGKWATASLEQPALQPWLATPIGNAWRRRVEQDRTQYAAALARSIVVIADGDLFAFDQTGARWYRLTRTYGGVIAAVASPVHRLGFVTRQAKHADELALGTVDLSTGMGIKPVVLSAARPIAIGYSTEKPLGFWVGASSTWWQLGDDDQLHVLGGKHVAPLPSLHFATHVPRLSRAAGNVIADWDDKDLASAMRVGTSNRIVAAPSPGLIDRNTIVWSPDRAHLAFVAQLDDRCKPGTPTTAAYVADVATGTVQELEHAVGGIAVEWIAERTLAIAGDRGVSVAELGGGTTLLPGATGLVTPKRTARCTPETSEPISDDESPEPGDGSAGSAAP